MHHERMLIKWRPAALTASTRAKPGTESPRIQEYLEGILRLWRPHHSCCFGLPLNSSEPLHQVMETSPYPCALRPAGKPMLSAPTLHRAHPLHPAFPLQMCCSSVASAWSLPSASSAATQMFPPAGDISHLAMRWPTHLNLEIKIDSFTRVWCGVGPSWAPSCKVGAPPEATPQMQNQPHSQRRRKIFVIAVQAAQRHTCLKEQD